MKNWKEVSLADYCKTQYGYTASATDKNTGVKFLRITDIVPEIINWQTVPFCEITKNDFNKYKLNEGDIVVARTGATVGYAKQIRKNVPRSVFASYLVKLIPTEEVNQDFLGILVESNVYKEFIQVIAGGSAQPNANANDLTLFKFFLPPISIQERIAAIVRTYDELIEINTERIKLLEKTACELYKEWIVRRRFPGYRQVKMVKGVPEGWKLIQLQNIVWVNKNNISLKTDIKEIFYIDISCVSTGKIENINHYNLKDAPGRARRIVSHGDTIFSTVRPENKAYCLILDPVPNTIASTGFAVVSPKDEFYAEFVYQVISDERFIDEMSIKAKGSAYPQVSFDDILKYEIILPEESIIRKYHEVTNPLLQQIQILQQQNLQLRQIRDYLLPRLISGKLPLKHPLPENVE